MTGRFYACRVPTFVDGRPDCLTCDGMLARGDFARDVEPVHYDVAESTGGPRCAERYDGLTNHEFVALSQAIDELIKLRTVWAVRADAEAALVDDVVDEPTSVDAYGPCCDGECTGRNSCEVYGG